MKLKDEKRSRVLVVKGAPYMAPGNLFGWCRFALGRYYYYFTVATRGGKDILVVVVVEGHEFIDEHCLNMSTGITSQYEFFFIALCSHKDRIRTVTTNGDV